MFRNVFFLFIFVFSRHIFSYDLVTNGDFESPLATGWTQMVSGDMRSTGFYTFDRANYDNDPDSEAYVRKYLHEIASLYQILPIPGVDINFSAYLKLFPSCQNNNLSHFAAAALILYYSDNDNEILGETRIFRATTYCSWRNTPTVHLIQAPDTTNWYYFAFNIINELANLPAVNPADVKRLKLALYGQATHGC